MPITLVTGLPGHGKTLYTLARFKDEAAGAGRPVFHNGIKGLNIPNWQVWDVKDWQNLPPGALLVVDEAQFILPVRGRGAPDPWIEQLATHRHLGIDLVVITQDPMMIDPFVRRLVDRHFHVVRKFGTQRATIHEFANGVKESVSKSRTGSIRHEWRYPKAVFGLYTSSELHTVKRRIPARVYLLFSLPFILAGLVLFGYYRMRPDAVAARLQVGVPGSNVVPGGVPARPGAVASPGRQSEPMSALEYAQAYAPRVEGLPHTAPAYDDVTKPAVAPYPAACLASASKCVCASQQGTRLAVPDALCRSIADGGFFVAWSGPSSGQVVSAVPLRESSRDAGSVVAAGPVAGRSGLAMLPAVR